MREEAFQIMSYDLKFKTHDIRDTVLIPSPRKLDKNFDERLRESMDVDRMIEESN